MTEQLEEVNCIGYASLRMGYDKEERFVPCPEVDRVLSLHDEVSDIKQAKLIGVTYPGGTDRHHGPTMCHLAVVEEDGTITHRRKYGSPVVNTTLEEGLKDFIEQPEKFKIVFLGGKKDQK